MAENSGETLDRRGHNQTMAWLLATGQRRGTVLASVEVAATRRARRRGLLGRAGIEGALLLAPARCVHTARMRFAIDVAYLTEANDRSHGGAATPSQQRGSGGQLHRLLDGGDARFVMADVATYRPWRLGRPRLGCCAVLEAEAGSFKRWDLSVGDEVTVVGTEPPAAGETT